MNNFFTLNYWLNIRPGNLEASAQKIFLVFLLILVIISILAFIFKDRKGLYTKIWKSLQSFGLTNLAIGLLLLFFTYEMLPILSTRLLFLMWGVGMLVWIYFIVKKVIEIPKIKEEKAKEKEFSKYVP
jgi:hypothetical protein